MKRTEKYKQTEVGLIPSDWEVKTISEIVDVDPDNLGSSTNPDYEFKYISLEDVDYGVLRNISEIIFRNAPSRARRKVKKDDILISTVRPNLKSHLLITEDVLDWICSTGFSVLRSKSETNSAFLYNHFFAPIINRQIENLITGSNYPAINSKEVKALQIPLPPTKSEQTAIATALSDADALISSLEKLIAKKRNIKQGAMQKLLNPMVNDELLLVNEYYLKIKLGDVCEFSSGIAHENFIDEKGDYIVVNSKFISTNGEVKKYSKTLFCPAKKDDILIVLSDVPNGKAIAKCFFVEDENKYTVNQRIGIVKPKNIDSKYLFYILNRHKDLLAFDDGAKQTNLRNQDLLNLQLLINNTRLKQSAIAECLTDIDAEIESLETKLEEIQKGKIGDDAEFINRENKVGIMDKFQNKYRIPSARAQWWDYANAGAYFITICTAHRVHYFGEIVGHNVETRLIASLRGQIAQKYWHAIPAQFPFIELGAFVVMPNHIHGILIINDVMNANDNANANVNDNDNDNVETRLIASLQTEQTEQTEQKIGGFAGNKNPMLNNNISRVVRWYKGVCTFEMRKLHADFQWQSRFHDHIIRNDDEYQRIVNYINTNPENWEQDKFYKSDEL